MLYQINLLSKKFPKSNIFSTNLDIKNENSIIECVNKTHKHFNKINGLVNEINALNPNDVLNRGYSIAFNGDRQIVRQENDIKVGESFVLKTGKGEMEAEKKKSLSI